MASIPANVFDIPNAELAGLDDLACSILNMDRESIVARFDDIYASTFENCMERFRCKGMYGTFAISEISGEAIMLEGGVILNSPVLADALGLAQEIVVHLVSVHGYEELSKDPDNDMLDGMFYDAWGAAFSMACHSWLKEKIVREQAERGKYLGREWNPGANDVNANVQKVLLELIDPGQIGATRASALTLSPTMSICGLMGVSDTQEIEKVASDLAAAH